MQSLRAVILAGGSGSRLWPLSRSRYPKQFLALDGEDSLLQATVSRLKKCSDRGPIVVCNEEHRFLAAEQLRAIKADNAEIILESSSRNTAPAIATAAWHVSNDNPEAIVLVAPADHLIKDADQFANLVKTGLSAAEAGSMVFFGIKPTFPSTGYGYIEINSTELNDSQSISNFIEKPDLSTAEAFIEDGRYFWNAGIFMFKAKFFLEKLQVLEPEMYVQTQKAVSNAAHDLDFLRLDAEAFDACRSVSVDYAICEKVDNRIVLPFEGKWSDIGSWSALRDASDTNAEGNVIKGDTLSVDSSNCYIRAESRLVTAVGLKNIGIIETSDSVMVIDLEQSEKTKQIVEALKAEDRTEADFHQVVYRPWGSYESIATGDRFQVKRIVVKPGAALSLQKHHHRAEHWIVAYGTAVVTIDETTQQLSENQSTYIPLGAVHRLENPGKIPLILIEVQSGSYLGEDDIVRLEDVYGRN